MQPVATAKGVLRLLTPAPLRNALDARAYARSPAIAPAELGGLRLRVPPGYEDHYAGGYEPDVRRALESLVEPGSVCADVGAHLGYFTLLMADRAGAAGAVTAFEAAPTNAAALRATVRLNGLERRVTVVRAAVADRDGHVALHAGRGGGDMEWSIAEAFVADRRSGRRHDHIRVPAVSLDSHFAGRPVDVVKLDVEGAEGTVLQGARTVLREQRPVLLLEFHSPDGWPAIGELLEAGYRLEGLDGVPLGELDGPDAVPYHLVARPA